MPGLPEDANDKKNLDGDMDGRELCPLRLALMSPCFGPLKRHATIHVLPLTMLSIVARETP